MSGRKKGLLKPAIAVFRKEMLDGARDRRSIFSALLFPLFGPLMIMFMFGALAERESRAKEVTLPVVGAQYAPSLIDHLEQKGLEITEGPEDPRAAVKDGKVAMVLVIPEEYPERWQEAKPAPVRLIVDGARDDTRSSVRRVRRTIGSYGQLIGTLRLVDRGVSPELANPIALDEVDVASAQKLASRVLSFIPMFVVMAAFIGAMNVSIDATAGERERGSLEPLLVNPVPRQAVVLGKWLCAVVFGCFATVLTLAMCVFVLERIPLEDLGLRFDLGWREVVGVLAASVPMAFLAAGLQMLVATFARSFKEAQTYLSLLIFLPVAPGVAMSVYPIKTEAWMSLVPALGQQVLLMDVIAAETPALWMFLVAGAAALLGGYLCVTLTARLFQRERIIYGR
jgi:sodium transport system permease protein